MILRNRIGLVTISYHGNNETSLLSKRIEGVSLRAEVFLSWLPRIDCEVG